MMETRIVNGMAYGDVLSITPGSSPYTWVNPEAVAVNVFVTAGTVSLIEFSNDNVGFVSIGLLGGWMRLNPGQSIKVTYLVAPTMKYTPN